MFLEQNDDFALFQPPLVADAWILDLSRAWKDILAKLLHKKIPNGSL